MEFEQNQSITKNEELGLIVYQGELKKKNQWSMKQVRTFVLGRDGEMKYYKDKTLYRGSIILCRKTKVIKTSRNTFEI